MSEKISLDSSERENINIPLTTQDNGKPFPAEPLVAIRNK